MIGENVLQLVVEHGCHRSPYVATSVGKLGNLNGFRFAVMLAPLNLYETEHAHSTQVPSMRVIASLFTAFQSILLYSPIQCAV